MSYTPQIVGLIRRRALAYELLAAHDADNLPVDPCRLARCIERIRAYGDTIPGSAADRSGISRWCEAVTATHGLSRRDGTRP